MKIINGDMNSDKVYERIIAYLMEAGREEGASGIIKIRIPKKVVPDGMEWDLDFEVPFSFQPPAELKSVGKNEWILTLRKKKLPPKPNLCVHCGAPINIKTLDNEE